MTTALIVLAIISCTLSMIILGPMLYLHRRWLRIHQRSRAVTGWTPGAGVTRKVGSISVRVLGRSPEQAQHVVVLLHGLATAGTYWGGTFDDLAGPDGALLVPDLLGFGESLDRGRSAAEHSVADHTDALESMLVGLGIQSADVTLVGHSAGGIAAAHLASRIDRSEQLADVSVRNVIMLAPPLHSSYESAIQFVRARGPFAKWLAVDRWVARAACHTICPRPRLARLVARLMAPGLPTAITHRSSMHSWESYVGTLRSFFDTVNWQDVIPELAKRNVPITIAYGARDKTIEPEIYRQIPGVQTIVHWDGSHQLPLVVPTWCRDLIATPVDSYQSEPSKI